MTARRSIGPRTAALVDVENLIFDRGARCHASEVGTALGTIGNLTNGMPVRAAMCEWVMRAYLPMLAVMPWGLETVGLGPDAADAALLQRGRDFAAAGYTDLIVVSGDHAFADLAAMARLHVVSLSSKLSFRLRLRAESVTLIHPQALTISPSPLVA